MSRKLFLSPHNDDEALFGAFTIQRERPDVCVVFDSVVQVNRGYPQCEWSVRRNETEAAVSRLTEDAESFVWPVPVHYAGLSDANEYGAEDIAKAIQFDLPDVGGYSEVWAPQLELGGHLQHNAVARAARLAFPSAEIRWYLTYTRLGGKSTHGREVDPTGAMVRRKLQALACYRTQLEIDALGCWPHFTDLREFVVESK